MSELEIPEPKQSSSPAIQFLAIVTFCYLVSFIGAEGAMRGLGDWYEMLHKPSWTPPNWLFAPVWTVLYGMMGVAAWQVWRAKNAEVNRRAMGVFFFVFQILLNGLWSWLFFAFHMVLPAAIEIGLLWSLIGFTIWAFARVKVSAALLLVPYWLWVSFATCLNFAIHQLNK
jgi:tryptophan-rich sensory protein